MNYIGIDPGKKGAFAVISGNVVYCVPLDETKFVDEMRLLSEEDCIVCLEHVAARPGQGVTSMFNFGRGFGFIQGVLTAFRIPFELVRPQKWQGEFSVSDKNQSIAVCKRLFPGVSLLPTDRSRVDSDGMSDALLMAEYARRRLG